MAEPSTNGGNGHAVVVAADGRDQQTGQFAKGWKGGPGNPYNQRVMAFRAALMESVSSDDLVEVTKVLVEKARDGNLFAIRELFDRLLGKPDQAHKIVAAIGTNVLTPEQVAELILAGRGEMPPA